MSMRRAGVVIATLLSTLAPAQQVGAEVEVAPGTAREPLSRYHFDPDVAFTTTGWGLFWQDDRSGHGEVWSALLDLDGTVTVPGVRRIASRRELSSVKTTTACSLPPRTVLALTSWDSDSALLFLSDELRVLKTVRLSTSTDERPALGCQSNPPLWVLPFSAYPTTGMQVVAFDSDGGFIDVDGGILSNDLDVVDVSRARPAVAFDGMRSLVVWAAGGRDGGVDGLDVYGAFVSGTSAGTPFRIAGGPGDQGQPAVSWHPNDFTYRVAYEQGLAPLRDVSTIDVAPDGTVSMLTRPVASTAEDETKPTIHFSGTRMLTTWLTGMPKPDSLLLQTQPPQPSPIELYSGYVDSPHVATDGVGRSMVQLRSFDNGIRVASRLIIDPLDAGPLIDPSTSLRQQTFPRMSVSEPASVVAWQEAGQTWAVSLRGDSGVTALGGEERLVTRGAGGLVVLTPQPNSVELEVRDLNSLAPRIGAQSWPMLNLISASEPVATGSSVAFGSIDQLVNGQRALAIDEAFADGGRSHLAVGTVTTDPFDARLAYAPASETWGLAWATHNGVTLKCIARSGAPPVEVNVGAGTYFPQPALVAVGEQFLVTWLADQPTPPWNAIVMARRFDSRCVPLDATALELGSSVTVSGPSVVFDGVQYVIAWASNVDVLGDVHVRTVSTQGVVGPVIPVQQGAEADLAPVIGALSRGHWLIAYTRFHEAENESARRLHLRRVDDVTNGTTCTLGAECSSGFCVAGVCCNATCDGACNVCESGQCTLRGAGAVCRASNATCDVAEQCTGTQATCPADTSGATCAMCNGSGPTFMLTCGVSFMLPSSSIPTAPGAPVTYSLRRCDGSSLPTDLLADPATGAVTWTPPGAGALPLLLVAQGPNDFTKSEFNVLVSCDGGVPDAGTTNDAGTANDAGTGDDAGTETDAGVPDGGALPPGDGGAPVRRVVNVSCGCTSIDALAPLLFALAWLRRRARPA